ncbi:recombinase family protein [Pseudomonas aeruginosa]|uniref:recombinase family protein n=1 Tax=Pseudomonas aeruginosa TaxID=287 RepID=UPI0009A3B4B0|nr:recombinase family protein [Pseudomonas aeruginosa]MBX6190310.1 recombinase family protein [Pseudomonas aeruginosa]MBX6716984.1 recombinase family protein [Pseudomonas aeruginosa]MBX6872463.1 recombinase family protein [Pseudomonas aeruginosa]QKL12966.1 recombinase family protein [Pseudomonas aeruginosa]QQV96141.1 recombinase family protein [Pseudomonas aeruginosa]
MTKIGYARVSTEDQDVALQIRALESVGCKPIFTDRGLSGGSLVRPGLEQALRRLRPGDKLVVWRLDRLGRSLVQLVQLLDQLGKRNIGFCSLNEHIDTNSTGGRLVFHIMAAMAEFERGLISERTRAGMAAAKAQGRHLGRQPSLTPRQKDEAARQILVERRSYAEVATHFNIHPRTLRRLLKELSV